MKRKIGHTATSIIFAGIVGMIALHISACARAFEATEATADVATDAAVNEQVPLEQVPVPKLQLVQTIDLSYIGSYVYVQKLSFSPDGRYLAIVVEPTKPGNTDIVVWDMKKEKPQSHIHAGVIGGALSIKKSTDLLWSRDGKIISFGVKRQWNPMTGKALPDNPAIGYAAGYAARLNKDSSKMLTIAYDNPGPHYIHIYDTSTWEVQKLHVGRDSVKSAVWTSEGNILIFWYDSPVSLVDPSGREATRRTWLPAAPGERSPEVNLAVVNFNSDMVALDSGHLINGKTLGITTYYSREDIDNGKVVTGTGGMVFDPSGKFLFIRGSGSYGNRNPDINSIVDTATGKILAHFAGGTFPSVGIAMRPDGKQIALGDIKSVQILSIQ